jgi:hypothetical protein
VPKKWQAVCVKSLYVALCGSQLSCQAFELTLLQLTKFEKYQTADAHKPPLSPIQIFLSYLLFYFTLKKVPKNGEERKNVVVYVLWRPIQSKNNFTLFRFVAQTAHHGK